MNEFGKIIAAVVINRVFVIMLGLFLHRVVRDYDLSASESTFIKWDAVYFMHIAKKGYEFEDQFAFYPGFPLLVRFVSFVTGLSIDVVGTVIPSVFYVVTAPILYKLTLSVGYSREFAWRTVQMWAIAPTSIFMCAPYTESLFAFLSFTGMLFWVRSKLFLSCLAFTLAGFVRSNGAVLAGFFGFTALQQFVRLPNTPHNILTSFARNLLDFKLSFSRILRAAQVSIYILPCLSPPVLFSIYANKLMCPGCEWCGSSPYTYIQKKYWGLGFMKFWRVNQIPNIALAVPIVFYITIYLCHLRSNAKLLPFALHLIFLIIFSLAMAHVNVTTRLVLAASPAAWWALASYPGKSVIVFCITYMIIGTSLFVNFLPWT